MIDLSYLDLMSGGDSGMKKMMIELLFDEPLDEIQSMYEMAENQNWRGLRDVTHKMKSTLAYIGNDELNYINENIGDLARSEDTSGEIQSLVGQMQGLYEDVVVVLRSEYNQL